MSRLSARFFVQVQSAPFYRQLHERAVRLLPAGAGKTWFDVGCGPGLVARLAAAHGYRATGFDIDPAMVGEARRIADRTHADFRVASVAQLAASGAGADVVSAASLLAVSGDREDTLRQLMSCVAPGGALLLVETTPRMTPRAAWVWLRKAGFGNGNWILLLWAWARRGRAALEEGVTMHGHRIEHADVFEGMVSAWLIRREAHGAGSVFL